MVEQMEPFSKYSILTDITYGIHQFVTAGLSPVNVMTNIFVTEFIENV